MNRQTEVEPGQGLLVDLADRVAVAERQALEVRALYQQAQEIAAAAAQGTAEEEAARALVKAREARAKALEVVLVLLAQEEAVLDRVDALAAAYQSLAHDTAASSALRASARVDNPRVGLLIAEPIRAVARAAATRRHSLARARQEAHQALEVQP